MVRVKYFGPNDISIVSYLTRIKEIYDNVDSLHIICDINDAIELYNVSLFAKQKIVDNSWDAEFVQRFLNSVQLLETSVAKFFISIHDDNIIGNLHDIDKMYQNDFIILFSKYNIFKKISFAKFKELLDTQLLFIGHILEENKLVQYYDYTIRDYLKENSFCAEIILEKYEVANNKVINLPKSLTRDDEAIIINMYIDSTNPNPNYLKLITNAKHIVLSDQVKLRSKKCTEDYFNKMFSSDSSIKYEYEVVFSKTQSEEVKAIKVGTKYNLSYSTKWFDDNSDYPTLLQNFIYLFEFVDFNLRLSLVSFDSELSVIEKIMGVKSKSEYIKGATFTAKECISSLQMLGYYEYLLTKSITLEKVIEWFFTDYLQSEFNIKSFSIEMPREELTYKEKCILFHPQMERVLKQIKQLKDLGEINSELLYFSSSHLIFRDIPSLIQNKYVYANQDAVKPLYSVFFSDQSTLAYIEGAETKYNNFYSIINNLDAFYDMNPPYNKAILDYYIKNKVIYLDNNAIRFVNPTKMDILWQLYNYNTINYHRIPPKFQNEILKLVSEGVLYFDNSFFSEDEQDYYNFYLNKSEFSNGHDLRNKYAHITQTSYQDDETTHKKNYLRFLILLVTIIIKLNDELCIQNDLKCIDSKRLC